jgi:hypothetical protein
VSTPPLTRPGSRYYSMHSINKCVPKLEQWSNQRLASCGRMKTLKARKWMHSARRSRWP